jgi:hypothetical protein
MEIQASMIELTGKLKQVNPHFLCIYQVLESNVTHCIRVYL